MRGINEYRFGTKAGQGMYIYAKTKAKAYQQYYKDYFDRYLKGKGHKRMTTADKRYAKSRLESIHLWKQWDKDGKGSMPKKKLSM